MMQNYNYKYYEPLEQMIAVRHQYMSKIIKNITHLNIYEYLKNKKIFKFLSSSFIQTVYS